MTSLGDSEPPVRGLLPGSIPLPVQVLDPDVVCPAVGMAVNALAGDEQLLRLLEAAVAQLHQVVEELRLVGSGTRGVAESIHNLSGMEWKSPAGEAFLDRSQRLRTKAVGLAETAEESAALARIAIDELHRQIAQLRSALQAAQAAVVSATTLGVC